MQRGKNCSSHILRVAPPARLSWSQSAPTLWTSHWQSQAHKTHLTCTHLYCFAAPFTGTKSYLARSAARIGTTDVEPVQIVRTSHTV